VTEEPRFTHQWFWVGLMWLAIGVFAALYWQHPHLLDWTGIVNNQ
jgi:hypothetical protein